MGKIYIETVMKKKSIRIGLLNVGEEEGKGNNHTKKIFSALQESSLDFVGNIEGSDLFGKKCNVIVTDGFVGNIALKVAEGTMSFLTQNLKKEINKSILSKIGAFLWLPAIRRLKKKYDSTEYGGAPLLGVNGICLISHGSSNAKAISNAIKMAEKFSTYNVNKKIVDEIKKNNGIGDSP